MVGLSVSSSINGTSSNEKKWMESEIAGSMPLGVLLTNKKKKM